MTSSSTYLCRSAVVGLAAAESAVNDQKESEMRAPPFFLRVYVALWQCQCNGSSTPRRESKLSESAKWMAIDGPNCAHRHRSPAPDRLVLEDNQLTTLPREIERLPKLKPLWLVNNPRHDSTTSQKCS